MDEFIKDLIDKKRMRNESAAEAEAKADAERYAKARNACFSFSERIASIIETANYCIENGISLPDKSTMKNYGYDYDAYAESFYHGVGFKRPASGCPITHLCVKAGGACGHWDFYATSNKFYVRHENDSSKIGEPDVYKYEFFADRFPKFERAFYGWIKDGMK